MKGRRSKEEKEHVIISILHFQLAVTQGRSTRMELVHSCMVTTITIFSQLATLSDY